MASKAQLLAVHLGGRTEKTDPPAAPKIPQDLGPAAAIAALARDLAEFQSKLSLAQAQRLDGLAEELGKGSELLGRLLEVVKSAPAGLQKDQAEQLLAELGEVIAGKVAGLQKRLDSMLVLLESVVAGQENILQALYAPVVPKYDHMGRVISAQRQQ